MRNMNLFDKHYSQIQKIRVVGSIIYWLLGQTIAPNGLTLETSWPCNGSQLIINFNEQSHAYVSSFDTPFGTDHCMFSEGIPLVLHFSEPVKGVNASTVRVK